jgi:hypothetical protein
MARLTEARLDFERENWIPWILDIELNIGSFHDPRYKAEVRRLMKPHRRRAGADELSEGRIREVIRSPVAKYVLRGWRNWENDDGSPMEYSIAKAEELLADERLDHLYTFILNTGSDAEAHLAQAMEDDAGN